MFIWLFSKYFFWIQISWLRVQSFSIQSKAHLLFISSNICGVRAGEVCPVLVPFFIFFNPLPINLWPVLEHTKNVTFFWYFGWVQMHVCGVNTEKMEEELLLMTQVWRLFRKYWDYAAQAMWIFMCRLLRIQSKLPVTPSMSDHAYSWEFKI